MNRLIDVRSPTEFAKGHVPGALSLPLFSDEERAEVGTLYKQVGQREAILLGLECAAEKAKQLLPETGAYTLYCWRGGMRSEAMAHFFQAAGIEATAIPGGYKAYRQEVLKTLEAPRTFKVLSGKTGAGKTEVLRNMKEPILDLEGLAHHRGSSFGHYETPQPTQEQFENELATQLDRLEGPIWVEDESRMIGKLKIPDPLWRQMEEAPRWILDPPLEERIARLIDEYGKASKETLIEATERLRKKLGGERTSLAIAAIERGDYPTAVGELLHYYDKAYAKSVTDGPARTFRR